MNDSADEEEENNIVSQVLDEIGIEISGQVGRSKLVEYLRDGRQAGTLVDDTSSLLMWFAGEWRPMQ